MPIPRSGTQAAVLDGKIFLFGGEKFGGVYNNTEMFDPVTERWTELTPMPVGRHGTQAVTFRKHDLHSWRGSAERRYGSDQCESGVRVSVSAIPRLPITPKCVTPVRRANRKLCRRRANRLEAIYEIGSSHKHPGHIFCPERNQFCPNGNRLAKLGADRSHKTNIPGSSFEEVRPAQRLTCNPTK
jgi:hypothetical protein